MTIHKIKEWLGPAFRVDSLAVNGYIYAVDNTRGTIEQINETTGVITSFAMGKANIRTIFADSTYLYAGCNDSVIKIDQATMVIVGEWISAGHTFEILCKDGDNLYIGQDGNLAGTCKIIRIAASTMVWAAEWVNTLTQQNPAGACVDNTFLYVTFAHTVNKCLKKLNKLTMVEVANFTSAVFRTMGKPSLLDGLLYVNCWGVGYAGDDAIIAVNPADLSVVYFTDGSYLVDSDYFDLAVVNNTLFLTYSYYDGVNYIVKLSSLNKTTFAVVETWTSLHVGEYDSRLLPNSINIYLSTFVFPATSYIYKFAFNAFGKAYNLSRRRL